MLMRPSAGPGPLKPQDRNQHRLVGQKRWGRAFLKALNRSQTGTDARRWRSIRVHVPGTESREILRYCTTKTPTINLFLGNRFFDNDQVSFSAVWELCLHKRKAHFRCACCSLSSDWLKCLDVSVSGDNRKQIQNPDSLWIYSKTSLVSSWSTPSEFLDYPSWIKQTESPAKQKPKHFSTLGNHPLSDSDCRYG